MYKVINRFKDLQHGHTYEVDETYPADGKKLEKSRVEKLLKKHPKYGVEFLEEVEEKKESKNKSVPKNTKSKQTEKSDD